MSTRRPYAFRGRHLTAVDLAVEVERQPSLRALRVALAERLGADAGQEEAEQTLAQVLDEVGEELLEELCRDVDAILRTWSRLADTYRTAGDRAEMGRIALELGELPGRLQERLRMLPNAGGLIDAVMPTGLVARLRYPLAAGRVAPDQLASLGQQLKVALPGAVARELVRVEALDALVQRAVQPLLGGLSSQALGEAAERGVAEPTGVGWEGLDAEAVATRLSVGPLRLVRRWTPRAAPTDEHLPQGVEAIALAADGSRAVWGPWEPWVQPLGPDEGERRLGGLDGRAWWRHCLAAAVSADGRLAAAGGASITVWDLGAGRVLVDLAETETHELHALAFSPDGRRLVAAGASPVLRSYEVGTGEPAWEIELPEPVQSLVYGADGRRIYAGGWDGRLRVHASDTGACLSTFDDIGGCINGVGIDPAGRWVATAGGSGCIPGERLSTGEVGLRLWDAATGAVLRDMAGHDQPVIQVAFAGDRLLSISEDGTLRAWQLPEGRCVATIDLSSLDDQPCALAASATGLVLVGTVAGHVLAWQVEPT